MRKIKNKIPMHIGKILIAVAALVVILQPGNTKAYKLDAMDLLGQVDSSGNPVWDRDIINNGNPLDDPVGMVIDKVHHRMFLVVNYRQIAVYDLDSSNELIDNKPDYLLGSEEGTSENMLSWARGLAYDSINDRLFVADYNNHRVLIFDTSVITNGMNATHVLGQTDFYSNGPDSGLANMSYPTGVAYDDLTGRLFVSDAYNYRILVFDLSGTVSNGMPAANFFGLNFIQNIAIDSSSQLLFAADSYNGGIRVYNISSISDGMDAVNTLGFNYGCSISQMSYPEAVTVDSIRKKLFVGDMDNNRILVFDYSSGIVDSMNPTNLLGQNDFDNCDAQTGNIGQSNFLYHNDNSQTLYSVDSSSSRVLTIPTNPLVNGGSLAVILQQADKYGLNQDSSYQGNSTYLDNEGHRLFVADLYNNRVLVYELNDDNTLRHRYPDHVLGQSDFNSNAEGLAANKMAVPRGIALDQENGYLFVADYSNYRILVFDVSNGISDGMSASFVLGQSDFDSDVRETSINHFDRPVGLLYDENEERLFVGDNYRVLVFELENGITNGMDASFVLGQVDFTSVEEVPSQNIIADENPGLGYDPERKLLFVSEDPHRILIFDLSSGISNGMNATYVLGQNNFDSTDTGVSQSMMDNPKSPTYNPATKQLFVGDKNNNRVMIFDLTEITNGENAVAVLGQTDFNSNSPDTARDTLRAPTALAYDFENNRLFVNDRDSARITITQLPNTLALSDPILGQNYSETLSTVGGTAPYSYSVDSGTLPTGLSLDSSSGIISGVPTEIGSFDFTIITEDSSVTAPESTGLITTKEYILTVSEDGGQGGGEDNQVDAERIVSNLTPEAMNAEIAGDFIEISGSDPMSTTSATFASAYQFGSENTNIVIPKDTVMTNSNGGTLDITKLSQVINGKISAVKNLGNLAFFIPDLDLSFSKPVTINISVSSKYNGKKLRVYYEKETKNGWHKETFCKVQDGKCSFQTSHATTFAVTKDKLIDKNRDKYKEYKESRQKATDLNKKRYFSVKNLRNTAKEEYFKLKNTYEKFKKSKLNTLDPATREQVRTYNGYLNYREYVEYRNWAEGN